MNLRMAAIVVVCLHAEFALAKSNFVLEAPRGPYAVGFRVVQQYERSRSFLKVDASGNAIGGDHARPIQTLIWYPATIDRGAMPMAFGSYLDLMATEHDFSVGRGQLQAKLKKILEDNYISKNYDRERVEATHAFRDARPERGQFPVVIYAPSLSGSAIENADLCEYLASYGYIVLASPSMGLHSPGMTWDLKGIEAQVADIEFLISYLHSVPEADGAHIAVAGWSWGGMSNIFAAAQDWRVDAIVSLDGGFRYQSARMKEGVSAGLVDPNSFTVPTIYFSSKPYTLEELHKFTGIDMSYDFLDTLKYNDLYFVQTSEMIHPGFSSFFIRFREDQYFTDYTPAEFSRDYSLVALYTLQFLQAYLKNDAAALAYLKNNPEKNGVPQHLFEMNFRPALHPAANITDFSQALAAKGYDQAVDFYNQARRDNPEFKLPQNDVNRWGYALLREGEAAKAVAVFRLNTVMYPESWNTYDSLGEAQEKNGDTEAAIASYGKSLALNPSNGHAADRLNTLSPQNSK